MIERKIDTIITDQYGNANYTYTGGGKGKRDIVMKCGKVQSETYSVTDCLFYDDGSNTEWYNPSNRITRTENNDGSVTLSNDSSSLGFYLANKIGTAKSSYSDVSEWELGLCVEFTIVSTTDTSNQIQIYNYSQTISSNKQLSTLNATEDTLVRILINTDGTVQYKVNNSVYNGTNQQEGYEIGLRVNTGSTLTYKDFKIYPI